MPLQNMLNLQSHMATLLKHRHCGALLLVLLHTLSSDMCAYTVTLQEGALMISACANGDLLVSENDLNSLIGRHLLPRVQGH